MPKIKTCKAAFQGVAYVADLKVDSTGTFSILKPGAESDWPHGVLKITAKTSKEAEELWHRACREFSEMRRNERKVIAVRFDSPLRDNGNKSHFSDDASCLTLRAIIAMECSVEVDGKVVLTYRECPEYSQLHGPETPIPCGFRMRAGDISFYRDIVTVVDWSQEVEDAIVRACKGIQAIVDMLDEVFETPETLKLAVGRLKRLAPELKPE